MLKACGVVAGSMWVACGVVTSLCTSVVFYNFGLGTKPFFIRVLSTVFSFQSTATVLNFFSVIGQLYSLSTYLIRITINNFINNYCLWRPV
jgi:hypothetical protein